MSDQGITLKNPHPKDQWLQGRTLLAATACMIAALALLPLGGLVREGLRGLIDGTASLGADGLIQIRGTCLLYTSDAADE